MFICHWEVFCTGFGIDEELAPSQLFQCTGTELGNSLLKANANAASDPLPQLLDAMCSLAIILVATCVLRTELLQLQQERDETGHAFSARVRGKAETCAFTTKCKCGKSIDYTDHIICDVLLNGLFEPDIRHEILGTLDILKKPVNDVVALMENKEVAQNALSLSTLSAMSSFKHQTNPLANSAATPSQADQAKEGMCPDCKSTYKLFTGGTCDWNTKPHPVCIHCYRTCRHK